MIDTSFKSVPLKDVIYFQEGPGLRNWQYGSSGVPFLNIRTITDEGAIDKSLCQYVKQDEFEGKYEHFLLEEGDYVVSSSGTLGKLAEIRAQDLPLMLNTSVIRFRPLNPEVLNRAYLKWFIKSPLYMRQIQKASTGTAIKNYGPSHLKQMVIPLPPIEEQRRIAAILDKADAVRRKRQQAIALTEKLLRSAFLEIFGDPVTNPKGWDILSMDKVVQRIEAGWSANGEDCKCEANEWGVLKISAVTSGRFQANEHKVVKDIAFKKSLIIPQRGDLLFSRANTRELVAATCLVEESCERLFLPDKLWRITPDPNIANTEYLRFLLTDPTYRRLITRKATGTSGSMLNVSQAKLLEMYASVPPLTVQKRFAEVVWQAFGMRERHELAFAMSDFAFNSLLQKAFCGRL